MGPERAPRVVAAIVGSLAAQPSPFEWLDNSDAVLEGALRAALAEMGEVPSPWIGDPSSLVGIGGAR